ncbi:hypothetical protein Rhal01_01593 [Rubritalea halochordaticola]|uniref:PAC domain-containing protein n=2 Tax=Rubritalea halochordaticola TaxID=714537 RepID=A0ABP9UYU7_9BACT
MEMTFQDTLNLVLKASNEGVWDWYVGSDEVYYSDRVRDFMGWKPGEEINIFKEPEKILFKPDVAYFSNILEMTLADSDEELFAIDCRIVCPNGRKRWLRIRGIVTWQDEKPIRLTGSMIDISKRKRAEAALEEERSMLRLVIDHVPVQVFFKDTESRYVMVNQRQCDWIGAKNPEEILGKTPEGYFTENHWNISRSNDLKIMETGESIVDQIVCERWKNRPDTYVQIVKRPWWDSRGKLKGTFGISTDVTKLISAKEKLEQMALNLQMRNRAYMEELQLAREVQQALLPGRQGVWEEHIAPMVGKADIAQRYIPATELAGDYYDVMPLEDGKVGIFIADVMGHGVRSALVVGMIKGVMEKASSYAGQPAEFMSRLNQGLTRILGRSKIDMFTTACYVVLDFERDHMCIVSAGHDYPLFKWRGESKITGHESKGPALGLFMQAEYHSVCCSISDVDTMLMYTDGIYESSNINGDEWGIERLEKAYREGGCESMEALLDYIDQRAMAWMGEKGFDDDVCLIGVRMKGANGLGL